MDDAAKAALASKIKLVYAAKGEVCKLGYIAFMAGVERSSAPMDQQLVKDAFYMGIQHAFTSLLMGSMENVEDETISMLIMNSIDTESNAFMEDFLKRYPLFAGEVIQVKQKEPNLKS